MPRVDVNLDAVVEKPRLPVNQPFTWQFKSATLEQSKNPNKQTGNREWNIAAVLTPLEPDWNDRELRHWWSLSPGALESDDPTFSIKKFFLVVGHKWDSSGGFHTEDLMNIRFVATLRAQKDDERFRQLDKILQGA